MPDILDDLLAEALAIELRSRRGTGSVKRLRTIGEICRNCYSPENWRPGRILLVIHNDPEIGPLGYFHEYLHRTSSARRLIRLDSQPELYEIEIVEGLAGRGPMKHVVDPPTEGEISAMRQAYRPRSWRPRWLHKRERTVERILREVAALRETVA